MKFFLKVIQCFNKRKKRNLIKRFFSFIKIVKKKTKNDLDNSEESDPQYDAIDH